jgi:menaquinone-dependent protoporphyrinogen IX oxidase
MNTIILYKTKLGSSKKYATWLGEAIGAPVSDFGEEDKTDLSKFSRIIFLSGTYGGRMPLAKFLKNNWEILADKEVVAVALGLADPEGAWGKFSYKLIPKKIREGIKYFRLPGNIGKETSETVARTEIEKVITFLNH